MEDVEADWEEAHPIRALVIVGKDPVGTLLRDWKKSSPTEHRKILRTLEQVAKRDRVLNENLVRRDAKKTGIHEMKCSGHPRIFFFYDSDEEETVVCVLPYWKGKESQSQAFEKAARLKDLWTRSKTPTD